MRRPDGALAHGDRIQLGSVTVRLTVNARAKRTILRIDAGAREAVAVAPSHGRLEAALTFARARRTWLEERLASAPAPWRLAPGQTAAALQKLARRQFDACMRRHCAALGVDLPSLSLTTARTRWGSCTPARGRSTGAIRISWRLVLAPTEVADYVVAHECAHLKEANHGARFWVLVRSLVGEPGPRRAWLRRNGAALHALEL